MSFSLPSANPFDSTMLDLFCLEIEEQGKVLSEGLIQIEKNSQEPKLLESLMRAAHSIKGAARVLNLEKIVHLAHTMEDIFSAAQRGQFEIKEEKVGQLLRCTDFLIALTKVKVQQIPLWIDQESSQIEGLVEELTSKNALQRQEIHEEEALPAVIQSPLVEEAKKSGDKQVKVPQADFERVLRMTAENLNRLMGLAGESLVESHRLIPFASSLQDLKKIYCKLEDLFSSLKENLTLEEASSLPHESLDQLNKQIHLLGSEFGKRLAEFDQFIWRHAHLSDRLYHEAVKSRMRPFSDGIGPFPRLVRDLACQLGKKARIDIEGKSTLIDREMLEKLESPLSHLIRNAVDHGLESPGERAEGGKPVEGVIKLEAFHRGGLVSVVVSDDGRGIDVERLREKIIEKEMESREIASQLSDQEVIQFLFLPGFSTAESVTEISGRGVGLDVVLSMIQQVGGTIQTHSTLGKGTSFHLQLPLTLSVIRALLVEIAGEVYAFPLARIEHAFQVLPKDVKWIENRQFFHYEEQNVGLVPAWEILDFNEPHLKLDSLPVIVLSDGSNYYGVVVDRFIGEKELVLQELDPRLGKVPDISAGALLEDGSPLLIIDIEDMIRSIEDLLSGGRLAKVSYLGEMSRSSNKKRILVVDDSLTVREAECRLLVNSGYVVETAVNGVDGWNAVRLNDYDLVITDIDMPRMNGLELLEAIRKDPKLQSLPVMIVSYKEGEEHRRRGKEAGADDYLIKSSFQDATLINAVKDLIGEP